MSELDVIVIGAGAAGLAAGLELARAGRRVMILEARDRIGGRIFTLQESRGGSAAPIELGAEFIHGRPPSLWALIEQAQLPTYELQGSQVWCAGGTLRGPTDPPDRAYEMLEDMTEWIAHRAPDRDLTFADYLIARGITGESAQPAMNYVEGFNAADVRRISVTALARQQRAEDAIQGDRLFRIHGGYASLPEYLADEFVRAEGQLRIAHPVRRITWQRGAVSVECSDQSGRPAEYAARCLVLTVPLGVLQAGTPAFDPRPDALIEQARRLEMGHVVRVVLKFSHAIWQDDAVLAARPELAARPDLAARLRSLSFLFTPTETPATWWTPMPDPTPLLTGWAGGPRAERLYDELAAMSDSQALRRRCITTLAHVLGLPDERLDTSLIECHMHDWRRDPYARGAYSYVPVGALDAAAQLATPVEDTLFVAGEHTHTADQWGTVHAALESGVRAARQVLAAP